MVKNSTFNDSFQEDMKEMDMIDFKEPHMKISNHFVPKFLDDKNEKLIKNFQRVNSINPFKIIAIESNRENAEYIGTENLFSPRTQLTNTIMITENKKEIAYSKNTIITENIDIE